MEMSGKTVGFIERAERDLYEDATIQRLEKALRLTSGSIQRLLDGGLPQEIIEQEPARRAATDPPRQQVIWERWAALFGEQLSLEVEYARLRGLKQPSEARDELVDTLLMAQQGKDGRPWVPPWEELSDDEADDQIAELRRAGLMDEHGEPIGDEDDAGVIRLIPEPPLSASYEGLTNQARIEPDVSRFAAFRGESEGQRLRREQDESGEAPDQP
jgi:hypothetical protein